MKKVIAYSFNWFVIATTIFALIGVNISTLYCAHCDEKETYIAIASTDKEGCEACAAGESDCCKHEHDHTFYKVTDFLEVEQRVQSDIAVYYLPEFATGLKLIPTVFASTDFSLSEFLPDTSPTQAMLCVFIC